VLIHILKCKLVEQTFVITVSKLIKNSDTATPELISADNLAEIASVVEALAGEGTVVELETAQ
jgi:hypothetical protein